MYYTNNEADDLYNVKSEEVYQRNVRGPKENEFCAKVRDLFNIMCNVYV